MPKLKIDSVGIEVSRGTRRPRLHAALIGAAGLIAGLAPAAFAEPAMAEVSQQQAQPADEASTTEDRLVLLRFSRCIAQRQPTQARALLLADYRTEAYRDSLRRLATPQHGCLQNGGRLRFGGVLFAGDLAETLLVQTAPRGSLAERTALNPAAPPLQARDQGEVMSLCIVRAAPADTEALLATEHGSPQEAAALRSIAPHISPCLASGAEMRLNRPGLRALLALAAYRLVRHNAAAPTAVEAGN